MTGVEETGRTVEDALERALAALGVSRDDVLVEILEAGSRGILGLGARDARVRVILKEGPATLARVLAERLFLAMGHTVTIAVVERDGVIYLDVRGHHLGPLIGRGGATLDALEVLLGLMTAKRSGEKVKVHVDVEGYRERRRRTLEDLARRIAERVQQERRELPLDPMDPRERRIIHTALAGHPHVVTYSQGEGALRRVVVAPKLTEARAAPPSADDEPVGG